jgi:hypothetical protein
MFHKRYERNRQMKQTRPMLRLLVNQRAGKSMGDTRRILLACLLLGLVVLCLITGQILAGQEGAGGGLFWYFLGL